MCQGGKTWSHNKEGLIELTKVQKDADTITRDSAKVETQCADETMLALGLKLLLGRKLMQQQLLLRNIPMIL